MLQPPANVGRLKILFLTNWYPTTAEPARAVWVREQAKAAQLHDDVVLLHCVGPDPDLKRLWRIERADDEGIPTYRVWYRPPRITKASYFCYVWSVWQAFRHVSDGGFRPDVIHVHVYDAGGPAILIGKFKRTSVVIAEHFSSFPRRVLGPLDLFKAWVAFRWADMVLPVSEALRAAIEHYGIRARFQVVPNVVDTALFAPAPNCRRDVVRKRIVFVGQLVPVKDVPGLLQALSRLGQRRRDWHLDIVGEGAARTEYEQLVADLNLSAEVAFHGLKTKREVAEFMRCADFLVMSSLCETFSTPLAEALATGIPVLATRCGGPEEFVREEVGMLVPPGDVEALCNGLDYMLDHLHCYSSERISQYARERFSPECVGASLHAVYRAIFRESRRSRRVHDSRA